jgi:broad specificity phosphatase PhoE
MARRLLVVAHGRTRVDGEPVFGEPGRLAAGVEVEAVTGRVQCWFAGPENACRETAALLGADPSVVPDLAGPDAGHWSGRTPSAVAAEDPAGLQAWLSDPDAAPPDGESLIHALGRVGRVIDDEPWPEGRSVMVVTPAAARLLAIHALGGSAALAYRLDVRFGGRFELSGGRGGWRLLLT